MRASLALTGIGLLLLGAAPAALSETAPSARLVAFISSDCADCRRFSSEVLRDYWTSPTALELPISVIDVPALGTGGNPLRGPLRALPTFVLMQDGREAARIEGYPGRERLLALVEDMAEAAGALKRAPTD